MSMVACVVFFTCWNLIAEKHFYFQTIIFFLFTCYLFWLSGRLIVGKFPFLFQKDTDFNHYFVVGFFVTNSLLLGMIYTLPYSIITDLLSLFSAFCIFAIFFMPSMKTSHSALSSELRKERPSLQGRSF